MKYTKNQETKKSKKKRNYIIIASELVLLCGLLAVLWFVTEITHKESGIQKVEISTEDVTINPEVQEKLESIEAAESAGYQNIAFFGLDSTVGELTKGTRSDTIMIVSINNDTKEVRLMNVFRDTYLNIGNDTYNKCNVAYAKGGAKQAINMLNRNLDLDITDFVAVGFKGVMDAVDAVGGIYIDIDEGELKHINNYQLSMYENLKAEYIPVKETGYQKVNGLQAMAYCRIRQIGNDFQRTERQKEVLLAVVEEAKQLDIKKLTKIVDNVFGNIYTSVDLEDILVLLGDLNAYEITDEGGFPAPEYRSNVLIGGNVGSSIVCTDLEAAVSDVHLKLFDDDQYEASEMVREVQQTIVENLKYN